MNLIEESSIRDEYSLKRFLTNENALVEKDIPRAYFIGQSLSNFLIYESKIVDLNLVQAILSGGQIVNSQLLGMSAKGSLIESVTFVNSHLPKILLSHTTFKNCYFKNCRITPFQTLELGDSVLFEGCLFEDSDPAWLGFSTQEHCIQTEKVEEIAPKPQGTITETQKEEPRSKRNRFNALDL